jgi:hypothetical protein
MNFDEIMEYNQPYNQRNFNGLIEHIKSNNIVPYIGAGMSALLKDIYPLWGQFLNNTYMEFCKNCNKTNYDVLNFEDKADFLSSEIGKITFCDHLKDTFGIHHLEREISDFIDKPAYLLPIIFQNNLIVTTNYDKVIEKMYQFHNKIITVTHPGHFEALNTALREGKLLLFKIHGDISEPQTSIILTKEQYDVAYKEQALINSLKQIFVGKEILFLGCSLEKDRPLELMCDVTQPGMKNYCIISSDSNLLKSNRLRLENDYNTQAIIYPEGKHECLNIILNHIAEIVAPELLKSAKAKAANISSGIFTGLNLSEEWFLEQNNIQIKNLGNRYLPDINIELDLKRVFDALGKNESFYKYFINKSDELIIVLNDLNLQEIKEYVELICKVVENIPVDSTDLLDVVTLTSNLNKISKLLKDELKKYYQRLENEKDSSNIRDKIYMLNRTLELIGDYVDYIYSKEIKVFNQPFVLLEGEGGIGKSHLLADTIVKRNTSGSKSLLFLGQHFKGDRNPLNEILEMLNLKSNLDEFLFELNKIGDKNKSRVIIFIDALNEGNGKNIWKNYLGGIVEKLKQYNWIGLVMSIRTEYVNTLFKDNNTLNEDIVKVKHTGFSSLEYEAIKKYFSAYNIVYADIPFTNQEFSNPLFLRLFCEGYKQENIDLNVISIDDIYKNYLNAINFRVSEACQYSSHINIIAKVINAIVSYKYDKGYGNNFISIDILTEILTSIEKKYNIHKPLLDELLSEGVLTQNLNIRNDEYFYVTYEKLEDYIYAKLLINELNNIGITEFAINHKDLLYYEDILEAFAIALTEDKVFELFEVFVENKEKNGIVNAFIYGLKWRKSNTISSKTLDYINNVVLRNNKNIENLYATLILLSAKVDHQLNAEMTVNHIIDYPMPDRDALFIPLFDELLYEDGSSINRLLDWCLSENKKDNLLFETIRLTANMVSTFLISSNNYLRDKSTKALIHLLIGHIDVLIKVLEKYEQIDDPYILERLYAVAFGCIVSETSDEMIRELAMYVYNSIFKFEYVYPNILLRDYAKNIVDYAKFKLKNMDNLVVTPPYKSVMPAAPTDEEISIYKLNYNSPDFKDYYWGQNSIISSMQVEYSRDGSPGGYGDFGRYVFQTYFSNWKGMNYNDLKNIAIKKIFSMGYDIGKHGQFDVNINRNRISKIKHERIGKKYQWIALYELAAQVADNYKMQINMDEYGTKKNVYCKGSFEPNIRNIDPTVILTPINDDDNTKPIHKSLYTIPANKTSNEWLQNSDDIPQIDKLINLTYTNSEFLLLNGWYSWTEQKKLGVKTYQNPQKDFWIQLNNYIVKKDDFTKIISKLKKVDFMGRWLSEPNDSYSLYNKEYYWSYAFNFLQNPYYCGEEWKYISEHEDEYRKYGKVLIPTYKYLTERDGDTLGNETHASWYKPCNELFNGLNMIYGKENSVLYTSEGKVLCFDSAELLKEDIGFFINKTEFLNYIHKNGYEIFWTVLAEKRIISDRSNHNEKYKQPHYSGIYEINQDGTITGDLNIYFD